MHEKMTPTRLSLPSLAALLLVISGACETGPELGSTRPDISFEEFASSVYQEPKSGVYIVNGDTPVETVELLREFYDRVFVRGELIVNTVGGADDCWATSQRYNISYCVSQSSFGGNYDRVVAAMDSATGAWEGSADIDFVHVASQDGNCDGRNSAVVFDVRQVSGGQYLARAFFPSTSRRNRNILIDTSTYVYDDDPRDPLSLVGVLRHELGHTIGMRHEHTRPESGVCFEDNNWRELTSYDPASVMHYPQCNGTGDWSLTLTSRDRAGAADLYAAGGGGSCGAGGGGSCLPEGSSCTSSGDCCSINCKGKAGRKTCKGG